MDSYNKEIYFHLPGAFEFDMLYHHFLKLLIEKPYLLKDNAHIGSVYGSPGGIWNGGRLVTKGEWNKEDLESYRDFMYQLQIPLRFTFTNCLLKEHHLYDDYCNMLLEVFANHNNEIIVNSSLLEEYIRSNFEDGYRFISSTTKRLANKEEQLKEINKDYYMIVLDYDHNKDFMYLKDLPNKEKLELLCNAVCKPNCPDRVKHYKDLSLAQITHSTLSMECENCSYWYSKAKLNKNYIPPEEINSIYNGLGFRNYKLEGRTAHPLDLIEILLDYLIKDKYHLEVREFLQKIIIQNN